MKTNDTPIIIGVDPAKGDDQTATVTLEPDDAGRMRAIMDSLQMIGRTEARAALLLEPPAPAESKRPALSVQGTNRAARRAKEQEMRRREKQLRRIRR